MKPFLSFTESLHSDTRRAFYDHHTAIAQVMYLVLVAAAARGLMDARPGRRVLGLTLFILCYYLMPFAWGATHDHHRVS